MVWGFSIVGFLACLWGLYFFGGHAVRIYRAKLHGGKASGQLIRKQTVGNTTYLIVVGGNLWPDVDSSMGQMAGAKGPFDPQNPTFISFVAIPVWMPFLVFMVHPMRMAWWFYRRRRKGRCMCGYDLTGNASGVCPECGSLVKGVR